MAAIQAAPGLKPRIIKPGQPIGPGKLIKLPCANCIGCRLDRSKQWAIRLMHEAQLHEKTCFITLTYSDASLAKRRELGAAGPLAPLDEEPTPRVVARKSVAERQASASEDSLIPRDVVLFIKKLRKELTTRNPSTRVRYYLVGEYGDRTGRPHYHIALYGEDFADDRKHWRTAGSYRAYRSSRLEALWKLGNSEIGELTIESAAYIARYVLKKINGKKAETHYERYSSVTGERFWIQPEFARMSLKPAIGKDWLLNYLPDVYPHDYVMHHSRKMKPPRYYDKLMAMLDPASMDKIKAAREERAQELAEDNTPARLRVKETVAIARMRHNKRNLE